METSSIIAIVLFPVITLILGTIGGLLTAKKIKTWYQPLKKPKFNPPNWIFGPVWTLLYISIGFSGYIFWAEKKGFFSEDSAAWFFYFFQFFLNLIWTPIFFGANYLLIAAADIILMDLCTVVNIVLFSQKNVLSGCILIPYLCWISFATYLNFSIWYLNKNNNIDEKEHELNSDAKNHSGKHN